MDRSELENRLKMLVSDHLGVTTDKVTSDANFTDDLGADSLDMIELSIAAEDTLGLKLDDDVLEQCGEQQTFGEMVDFLEKAIAETC